MHHVTLANARLAVQQRPLAFQFRLLVGVGQLLGFGHLRLRSFHLMRASVTSADAAWCCWQE
jgi:hypothetical protein